MFENFWGNSHVTEALDHMLARDRLAQTLLENGLIDELRLSIHPVLAGAGLPQLSNSDKTPLTLVSAKTFTTGVVVLSYQTAGA